jgi:hypothetical protein
VANFHPVNSSLLNAGLVRLAASISASATIVGRLPVQLQGNAETSSTAAGTLSHEVRLAAAATGTATMTGLPANVGSPYLMNGAAVNTYALNERGPVPVAAAVTATATATAALSKQAVLAAAISGTATASATHVAGPIRLEGALSGTATIAGSALYTLQLAAAPSGTATATGTATYTRFLAGALTGTATASGTLVKVVYSAASAFTYIPSETQVTFTVDGVEASVTSPEISMEVNTTSVYANATF